MQFIYPYIMLKDSMEAANFYKDVFNGEITYVMLGKDTPDCPEHLLESVMHLQLKFNDNTIYFADQDIEPSDFMHVHLDYQNVDEMMEVYERLRVDSIEDRKPEKTFWGAIFGSVKDKFGVTWQLHYTVPQE